MALWGRYALPWGEGYCVFGKDIRLVLKVPRYFLMVVYRVMLWWMFRTSLKSVLIVKLIIPLPLKWGREMAASYWQASSTALSTATEMPSRFLPPADA